MNWEEVKASFAYDGSVLDMFIFDTNLETWQQLLDWLRVSGYLLEYTLDNEPAPLPAKAGDVFKIYWEEGVSLLIDVNGLITKCHFFDEETIEFSICRLHVTNHTQFNSLCEFMQRLGQELNRNVILTPEHLDRELAEQEVILRYSPATDEFHYTEFLPYT